MTVYSIDRQIFGHFLPPLAQIFNQILLCFTEIIATHSNSLSLNNLWKSPVVYHQTGWFRSKIHNYSESLLEGCVLANNLRKLNQVRHSLSHRKILMLVAGLISHQIEVKNDWNPPPLFGGDFDHLTHCTNIALYCIKFSQYNQQGSLIT